MRRFTLPYLFLLLSLTTHQSLRAQIRLATRRRHFVHSTASPTHVFTLQRACTTAHCLSLAVDALHRAGCTHVLQLGSLHTVKARCGARAAARLAKQRRFAAVAPDRRLHLAGAAATPPAGSDAPRGREGAHDAGGDFERVGRLRFAGDNPAVAVANTSVGWERVSLSAQALAAACARGGGLGVTVYVVDSGCRASHAELAGRATGLAAGGGGAAGAADLHGHGTHAAARVAGRRVGLARRARVVCVRALDASNRGSAGDVAAGIDLAARMHRRRGRRARGVLNVSLGVRAGAEFRTLDEAVGRARAAGLVVVAAAGNAGGDGCAFSPGRAGGMVSVGAADGRGRVAAFSIWVRCVDVAAHGVHVWSAGSGGDREYARASGTSMAAPFVSAVTALLLGEGVRPRRVPQVVAQIAGDSQVVTGADEWRSRGRGRDYGLELFEPSRGGLLLWLRLFKAGKGRQSLLSLFILVGKYAFGHLAGSPNLLRRVFTSTDDHPLNSTFWVKSPISKYAIVFSGVVHCGLEALEHIVPDGILYRSPRLSTKYDWIRGLF